jgi:hypothetical protein
VAGEAGLQLGGGNCGNLALRELGNAAYFEAGGVKEFHGLNLALVTKFLTFLCDFPDIQNVPFSVSQVSEWLTSRQWMLPKFPELYLSPLSVSLLRTTELYIRACDVNIELSAFDVNKMNPF